MEIHRNTDSYRFQLLPKQNAETFGKRKKILLTLIMFSGCVTILNFMFVNRQPDHKLETPTQSPVDKDHAFQIVSSNISKHLEFPEEVFEFLEIALKLHLELFVIEPCILWQLISGKEQDLLEKRYSVNSFAKLCTPTASGHKMMSLGVLPTRNFTLRFSHFLDSVREAKFTAMTYKQLGSNETIILHSFAQKNNVLIHISTFTPRKNFLTIEALHGSFYDIRLDDLRFGQYKQAFDRVSLTAVEINRRKVLIPSNTVYFLFETVYSHFKECQTGLAKAWEKEYPNNDEMTNRMNETVKIIRELTIRNLLPIWLDSGSLIGWARHCGQVPFEKDADFATHASMTRNSYDLVTDLVETTKKPWHFIELFGFPWAAFEMRLYNVDLLWQVDLFFITKEPKDASKSYIGYHTGAGIFYYKIEYNTKHFEDICSAELYGEKVMVPCRYQEVLVFEFGPGWVTPNETHSVNNIRGAKYWSEVESFYSYQCLGRDHYPILQFDFKRQFETEKVNGEEVRVDITDASKVNLSETVSLLLQRYKANCALLLWKWW